MNKDVDLITYNDVPNFSVVVPTICRASCAFCFDKGTTMIGWDNWYNTLETFVDKLPERFSQCSVTGGEPTALQPQQLLNLMELLKRNFKKIVVTTNGLNLSKHIGSLALADFINISYHGVTCAESNEVFRANISPMTNSLKSSIRQLTALGVKIRLQRVVTTPPTLDTVFEYVDFAKSLNVQDVAFRMDINNKDSLTEAWLPISPLKAVSTASCPVCVDWVFEIDGCTVHFKGGKAETKSKLPYELIYNKMGKLTTTWGKITVPVWTKTKTTPERDIVNIVRTLGQVRKPAGCGGNSGCGGSSRCKATSHCVSRGCGSSGCG